MNDNNKYLPEYTLNQLADRVAMKLIYLKNYYTPYNVWNGIIEKCQKIEEEARNISTIIVEAKKDKTILVSGAGVTGYHLLLTRTYILLYYRHRDNKIYQAIVFPELIMNMGIYGTDKFLKESINETIDKIIEEDKLVEQSTTISKVIASSVSTTISIPKQKNEEQQQLQDELVEAIDWHDKVRLDMLLRLMEKDGANLEKHGNKTKAAKVMQSITGLPLQTCKNYCTNRDLNTTTHEEEILKMNTLLQALEMEIRL